MAYLGFAVLKEAPEGDAAVRHVQDGLRDGLHHRGIDTEGGTPHPPRLARGRRPRGAGAAPGEGRPAHRGHGQDDVFQGDRVDLIIVACPVNVLNNVAAVSPAVPADSEMLPSRKEKNYLKFDHVY